MRLCRGKQLDVFLVNERDDILTGMKALNSNGKHIVLVVDDQKVLKGILSDGDIRRSLLNGVGLNDSVTKAMNTSPLTANIGHPEKDLVKMMRERSIFGIPLLSKDKVVEAMAVLEEEPFQQKNDNAVILMVGGLGSRLGELTENCPKPMLKVGDKPILEIIVDNFKQQGFHNFYFAVNYRSEMIEDYFKDGSKFGVSIKYMREPERLGTAGALSLFEAPNNLPVIVMNGDLLTQVNFVSMLEHHIDKGFEASAGVRQYDFQIPFGVVHVDGYEVQSIEEKPMSSCLVSAGIYVLNKSAIELVPKATSYDMPSLLEKMLSKKMKVGVYPVHEYWLDIGRKDDFVRAELEYFKRFK